MNNFNNLLEFIDESPNPFFAVNNINEYLQQKGFAQLAMCDKWDINKGGKYFISLYGSGCIAFVIGSEDIEDSGFKIITSHTDSPCFKLKPKAVMKSENYIKLNIEAYSGTINNTWLDRPLSLAGKIVLKNDKSFNVKEQLINIKRPILVIPNVAIHMNRKVNEGIELNKQTDLIPIMGLISEQLESDDYLLDLISKEAQVTKDDILDFELFLYPYEKSMYVGINNEFISAPRLDDLSMVYASMEAIASSAPTSGITMMAAFNNEEIGSKTKQGADSPTLSMVLERIALALGKDREQFLQSIYNSFNISADLAHATHPNKPGKHDPTNKTLMNEGVVLKISANQRYATDSSDIGALQQICMNSNIPYQKFVNRSDIPGGSTIGALIAGQIPIRTVDVGVSLLAMHSVRELMGSKDIEYIIDFFKDYYKI